MEWMDGMGIRTLKQRPSKFERRPLHGGAIPVSGRKVEEIKAQAIILDLFFQSMTI